MSASTRARTVLAAAVLVAGLAGCTAGDDDTGSEPTPSAEPTASAEPMGGSLVVGPRDGRGTLLHVELPTGASA